MTVRNVVLPLPGPKGATGPDGAAGAALPAPTRKGWLLSRNSGNIPDPDPVYMNWLPASGASVPWISVATNEATLQPGVYNILFSAPQPTAAYDYNDIGLIITLETDGPQWVLPFHLPPPQLSEGLGDADTNRLSVATHAYPFVAINPTTLRVSTQFTGGEHSPNTSYDIQLGIEQMFVPPS